MESTSISHYYATICHLRLQNQLRQRKLGKIKAKPGPSCTSSRSTRPVSWPTSSLELAILSNVLLSSSLEPGHLSLSVLSQCAFLKLLLNSPYGGQLFCSSLPYTTLLRCPSPLLSALPCSTHPCSSLLFSSVPSRLFSTLRFFDVFSFFSSLAFSSVLFSMLLLS